MLCPKIKHITRAAESLFLAAQIVIDWEKLRKGRDAMSGQNSAGKDFIRATWYRNMPQQSDQEKMLPQPPYELEPAPDARRVADPLTDPGDQLGSGQAAGQQQHEHLLPGLFGLVPGQQRRLGDRDELAHGSTLLIHNLADQAIRPGSTRPS